MRYGTEEQSMSRSLGDWTPCIELTTQSSIIKRVYPWQRFVTVGPTVVMGREQCNHKVLERPLDQIGTAITWPPSTSVFFTSGKPPVKLESDT